MNYSRIVVAAVAATVLFFIYGFLVHGCLIAKDYVPYPEGVYRSGDDARSHLLFGVTDISSRSSRLRRSTLKAHKDGWGVADGARLGVLFGVFMAGAFAAVNHGTSNISGKLALELAASELIEWTLVGIVIGLVYKPVMGPRDRLQTR